LYFRSAKDVERAILSALFELNQLPEIGCLIPRFD